MQAHGRGIGGAKERPLKLSAQAPFAGHALLDFLRARAIPGVERVSTSTYERVVLDGAHATLLRVDVRDDGISLDGPAAYRDAVRALFDLDAQAKVIDAHLAREPKMRALSRQTPGLRVPGAFDGFELAVRTVLGQQVSVAAATTMSGRIVQRFGTRVTLGPLETFGPVGASLFPTAARIAALTCDEIATIGLPRSRADTLLQIARAIDDGRVVLTHGAPIDSTIASLVALKGIGPWTAKYIAMRALGARDLFLGEDLVARKVLAASSVHDAETTAMRWAPWRSYALMHLWRSAASLPITRPPRAIREKR